MSIFGWGFRILLIAVAVLVERIGTLLRDNPLVRSFTASPPDDLETYLSEDDEA